MRYYLSPTHGPHVGDPIYPDDQEHPAEGFDQVAAAWYAGAEDRELARQRDDRIAAARSRLAALDAAAVRPLRAVVAGTATDADHTRLAEIEAEAQKLREALAKEG